MIESDRPLVTFALYAYNQEKYIREAVEAALCQDFFSIEVILSDDFSTDQTFQIMSELADAYIGPHKIVLNRNPKNLGVCEHINRVLQKARGEIVIHAAGDDVSLVERTRYLYERFLTDGGKTVAIFSNAEVINFQGVAQRIFFRETPKYAKNIDEFMEKRNCWALGCSFAFRKNIFNKYGPLDSAVLQEDGLLAFRSLLEGEIGYVDTPLVKYRIHDSNVSNIENPKNILMLQRKAYLMKKVWLRDALMFRGEDKKLIRSLKYDYFLSRIKSAFFSMPVLGYLYNYALLVFVKIVRTTRKLASNNL